MKGEQGKDRNLYIIHVNVNKKHKKHALSGQSTSNSIHNHKTKLFMTPVTSNRKH